MRLITAAAGKWPMRSDIKIQDRAPNLLRRVISFRSKVSQPRHEPRVRKAHAACAPENRALGRVGDGALGAREGGAILRIVAQPYGVKRAAAGRLDRSRRIAAFL